MAEEKVWYYSRAENQIGPFTITEIRALRADGTINDDSYVWREGWTSWQRLGDSPIGKGAGEGRRGDMIEAMARSQMESDRSRRIEKHANKVAIRCLGLTTIVVMLVDFSGCGGLIIDSAVGLGMIIASFGIREYLIRRAKE